MLPSQVIALLSTPVDLMRKCYLHIGGGSGPAPANGQARVATFSVSVQDANAQAGIRAVGPNRAGTATRNRHYVRILKKSVQGVTDQATEFDAFYVPMVQVSDIGLGQSLYVLPTAGGPNTMITSKLSGCLFGIGSSAAGALLVSHVQPNQALPREDRQADLAVNMWSGFHGNVTGQVQFGYEYANMATIIGHRNAGNWSFYCQTSDFNDTTYTIGGVTMVPQL